MEEDSLHRYPKRARLERKWKSLELHFKSPVYEKKLKIYELPPEVLHHIFRWLPSSYLVASVKFVSKHFEACVTEFLYGKFHRLSSRLSSLYHMSADIFDNARDIRIHRQMFRIVSNIEIMIHEFKILEATIWRYMYPRRTDFKFCICLGKILDLFDYIFFRMYYRKGEFTRSSRNQKALKKLLKTIKCFIFHFERHTETKMNTSCFVSGAKICDIFDSCIFSEREVVYEKCENGVCTLKLRYDLPNAWFSVISTAGCPGGSSTSTWQDQQRLMYLRLRRLASTHTGHQMHLHHYKVAQQLVEHGMSDILHITSSVYCGFGEFEDELFFYGNFNQGGYICKVRRMENRDIKPEELNSYNLKITVDLTCPVDQAPLLLYKKYCMHIDQKNMRPILRRRSARLEKAFFNMRIEFNSDYKKSYLPSNYVFVISEDKRLKKNEQLTKL